MKAKINERPIMSVALSHLERHPNNMRKTSPAGIAELAESIARDGLLNPLTVCSHPTEAQIMLVPAGGRRLAALQLLAKQKRIPEDYGVSVTVVQPEEAEAISLTENQMREAMHPIDQFMAFKGQVEAGHPIADVAARFGVTEKFVKQRLKLAAVAPQLLEAYRAGEMTLEHLQAFTVTDDQDLQVEVWEDNKIGVKRGFTDADEIRDELRSDAVSSKDIRLKFVGLANYQKAGGAIIAADLFASDDDKTETVSDPELLERLALEKLQKRAAKLQKDEGLAWCDVMVTASWYDIQTKFGKPPIVTREMTEAEAKLHTELEAKLDALQKQLDKLQEQDDYDEAEEDRLIDEMNPLEEQRDAIDDACRGPHPDAQEYVGAVVSIDDKGKIEIHRNLIRQADLKNLKSIGKPAQAGTAGATDDAQPAPAGHSEKLMRRMTAHKTAILRNEIVKTGTGGLGVIVYHMLIEDYGHDLGIYGGGPLTMTTRALNRLEAAAEDIDDSRAVRELEAHQVELLLPIIKDVENADEDNREQALYDSVTRQSTDWLLQALTLCVAKRVDVVTGSTHHDGKSKILVGDFLTDDAVADYWKPTRANYLDHVPRQQIIAAVQDAVTIEASEPLFPMKKAQAAEYAEGLLVASAWLPVPMRVSAQEA